MKNLTITLNFITPDKSELNEARDLTNYIIEINFIEIIPNDFGESSCKSIDFYKYYKEDEVNAGE